MGDRQTCGIGNPPESTINAGFEIVFRDFKVI